MTPVWGDNATVAEFVRQVCGESRSFGDCQAMGVINSDGNLVAGVVFHNWNPESEVIEVSAGAIDSRWATREVLRTGFGYAFSFCQMVVARTHEDNATVRRLWKAFGAQEVIIPRLRGRTASEAILTLTDDAWANSRFMRQGHGKNETASAA